MSNNTQDYYWNWEWEGLTLSYGKDQTGVPARSDQGWTKGLPITWNDSEQYYERAQDGTIIAVATADKANGASTGNIKLFPVVKVPVCGLHTRLNRYMANQGREINLTPKANTAWTYRAYDNVSGGSIVNTFPVKAKKIPSETWESGDEVYFIQKGIGLDGNDYSGYWSNSTTPSLSGSADVDYFLSSYFHGGRAKPSISGSPDGLIGTQITAVDPSDLWWIQQTAATASYPPHPNFYTTSETPSAAAASEELINGPICLGKDGILSSDVRKNNIYQNGFTWSRYEWETDSAVDKVYYHEGMFCNNPSEDGKIHGMLKWDTGYMRQVGTYTCMYETEEDFTIPASLGDDFYRWMKRYNMSLPVFCVDRYGATEYQSFNSTIDFTPQPFSKIIPASADPYRKLEDDLVVTWVPYRSITVFGGRGVVMLPIVAKRGDQEGGQDFIYSQAEFCGPNNKENLGWDYSKFLHLGQSWVTLQYPINHAYKDPERGFMRHPHLNAIRGFMFFPEQNIPSDPDYNVFDPIWDYTEWTGDYVLYRDLWNFSDGTPQHNGVSGVRPPYHRRLDSSNIKGRFFASYPQHDDRSSSGDIGLDGRECYWRLQKAKIDPGNSYADTTRTWTPVTDWVDITSNQVYTIPQGDGTPVAIWAVNVSDVVQDGNIEWWDDLDVHRVQFKIVYYNRPSSPSNPYNGPFESVENYVNFNNFGTRVPNFGVNFAEGGWWSYQFQGAIPLTTFKHHFSDVIANDGTTPSTSDPVLGNFIKVPNIGEWTWTGTMNDFVLNRNDDEYEISVGNGSITFSVDNSDETYCNESTFQKSLQKKTFLLASVQIEGRDGEFYPTEWFGSTRSAFLDFSTGWKMLSKTTITEDDFGDDATWDGGNTPCMYHDMLDYEYRVKVKVRAFGQIGNEKLVANPCQWYDVGEFEYTIPKLEEVTLTVDDATNDSADPTTRDTEITVDVSSAAVDDVFPPSPTEQVRASIRFRDSNGNLLGSFNNQALSDNGDGTWTWTGTAPPYVGTQNGTIEVIVNYDYTNYSFVSTGSNTFILVFQPQSTTNPTLTITNINVS